MPLRAPAALPGGLHVRERVRDVAASIGGAVKRTALAIVGDGNLSEQEMRHGVLVGRDAFGNAYFENRRYQTNRERWVMYADKDNYKANEVPPDWHAWLHRSSDVAPSSEKGAAVYTHPIYEQPWNPGKDAEVRPLSSFDPAVYMPKGYPKNPGGPKDFSVVRRWQPPGAPPLPRG